MITASRNTLTKDAFRLKLAGLVDEAQSITGNEAAAFEAQAIDLAIVMAELFGDELDRITLWSRIASGLEQSARENAGNALSLINGCLQHVKAEASKSACNDRLASIVEAISACNELWARQWARWIVQHIHIIVIKARAAWNAQKEERKSK